MRARLFVTAFALGMNLLAVSLAVAGPPFQTDDPQPPPTHGWELNFPFTMQKDNDGSSTGQLVATNFVYAYDDWSRIIISGGWSFSRVPGSVTRTSLSDLEIQYGRRFGRDPDKGYFGIAPGITLPTGNRDAGLGTGRVGGDFPVTYMKNISDVCCYTDLCYCFRAGEDGKSYWFWGVAGEHDLSERFSAGAELFANTATEQGGQWSAGFNLGLGATVIGRTRFLVSAGRSFRSDPTLTLYAGIQVLTKKEGN